MPYFDLIFVYKSSYDKLNLTCFIDAQICDVAVYAVNAPANMFQNPS